MDKKSMIAACALAGIALSAAPATASTEKDTAQGIAQYREMLADGNPAELIEMTGEDLWKEKRGPKQASLEQCDLGLGPGVVKGAYAQLPRYFDDAGRVLDLESRLVQCMVQQQGLDAADITKKPFSGDGQYASDIEALVAYVAGLSRGMTIAVPQAHPKEKAAFDRGREIFYYRGGPYDFACASCHTGDNKRIRLQDLPNLTKQEPARAAFASWPAYRVSQGAVRTMQWRLQDCFRQQRMPLLKYGSDASVDLTVFLGVNANGGQMAAPAIKR